MRSYVYTHLYVTVCISVCMGIDYMLVDLGSKWMYCWSKLSQAWVKGGDRLICPLDLFML